MKLILIKINFGKKQLHGPHTFVLCTNTPRLNAHSQDDMSVEHKLQALLWTQGFFTECNLRNKCDARGHWTHHQTSQYHQPTHSPGRSGLAHETADLVTIDHTNRFILSIMLVTPRETGFEGMQSVASVSKNVVQCVFQDWQCSKHKAFAILGYNTNLATVVVASPRTASKASLFQACQQSNNRVHASKYLLKHDIVCVRGYFRTHPWLHRGAILCPSPGYITTRYPRSTSHLTTTRRQSQPHQINCQKKKRPQTSEETKWHPLSCMQLWLRQQSCALLQQPCRSSRQLSPPCPL